MGSPPTEATGTIQTSAESVDDTTFRISDLCRVLDEYLEKEEISAIYDAFLFSAEAHDGQRRLTGEPYITLQ